MKGRVTNIKKVLILVSSRPADLEGAQCYGIVKPLSKLLVNAQVSIAALDELFIAVSNDATKSGVWFLENSKQEISLREFDLIIFRTVGDSVDIARAVASYLKANDIKFIDGYIDGLGKSKLSGASIRALNSLRVPDTAFVGKQSIENVLRLINLSGLSFPLVAKDDHGRKGRDNYLIKDTEDLKLKLSTSGKVRFVFQQYIKSYKDYRVLVLNNKVSLIIERSSKSDSHLNNTSQGGTATLLGPDILSDVVSRDVIEAVKLERLQVAGVDIIFDSNGQYYILEVNRSPQIASGAFVDEKMKAYGIMVEELLK